MDQAETRFEEGDLGAALDACVRAIDVEPENVDGHLLEAEILLRMDDPRGATESAREALELGPSEHAQALLGAALFECCELEEAKRVLDGLGDSNDDHAEANFLLGVIAEQAGRKDEAKARYARAAELDPTYVTVEPMDRERFDAIVEEALATVPEDIRAALVNVSIQVHDFPDLADLRAQDPPFSPLILGMFRGTPRSEQSVFDPLSAGPAVVVLYQRCLELTSRHHEDLVHEIGVTLIHEIGHYLGLDEDDLVERGLG